MEKIKLPMQLLFEYKDHILDINQDIAQLWGRLRVPHPENVLGKQIAATALIYNLTVVTRNHKDFSKTGVRLVCPRIQCTGYLKRKWCSNTLAHVKPLDQFSGQIVPSPVPPETHCQAFLRLFDVDSHILIVDCTNRLHKLDQSRSLFNLKATLLT